MKIQICKLQLQYFKDFISLFHSCLKLKRKENLCCTSQGTRAQQRIALRITQFVNAQIRYAYATLICMRGASYGNTTEALISQKPSGQMAPF
mgnify:CR=1 FL=1